MRRTLASVMLALMAQCVAVMTAGCADDPNEPFCETARCPVEGFCSPQLSACVVERVDHAGMVHLFVGGDLRARCGAAGIADTSSGSHGSRCGACQKGMSR